MRIILLIDDDADDAEIFKEALEETAPGSHFYFFHNQSDIQALLSEQMPAPQIIFLDINMSFISGWDCLKIIQKQPHLQDIPVIMYSTSSQDGERQKALDLGAIGLITKPNDYSTIKTILAQILNSSREQLPMLVQSIGKPAYRMKNL